MHRAAVAAFATIASVVVASLAAPAVAHGSDDPGVTFVDHVATADVVVVGQAHDVRPGRVLNGCQLTAATVRIEEVLLGDLPSPAPGDLTVEFAGDCRQVGALGGAVPTERAIWFLVNKGAWLREMVVPRSGDWSEEDLLATARARCHPRRARRCPREARVRHELASLDHLRAVRWRRS